MSTEKFQNKYRLKSARAEWHDYGGGAYFVTVCTKQKEHFFGEINDGQMQLLPIGKYLSENLQNITQHYPYAEIPLFVIMPNHWHSIVFIDDDKTPYIRRNTDSENGAVCRDGARPVSTVGTVTKSQPETNEQMQNVDNMKGWLSVVIGGLKSAITKFANEKKIDFAWQTRFHDHIIRDATEMNRIADYIENNPIN